MTTHDKAIYAAELTVRERNWLGDHGAAQIEAKFDRLLVEIDGYRRALVAHHDIATLSDEVIREYDWRECPVCQRARANAT